MASWRLNTATLLVLIVALAAIAAAAVWAETGRSGAANGTAVGAFGNSAGGPPDSDGDGFSDPIENDHGSDPHNAASKPEATIYQACTDSIDNDLDGLVDKADPNCDADSDGVPDSGDNCWLEANPPQADYDNDGSGDICDIDDDNDFFDDSDEARYGSNARDHASTPERARIHPGSCTNGLDDDKDGLIDAAEASCDLDQDGINDDADNCLEGNPDQADLDGDGRGNICDNDDDGDGFFDWDEYTAGSNPWNFASQPESSWYPAVCSDGLDNDLDLYVDGADRGCDYDLDGVLDQFDNCKYNSNPDQADSDADGRGDPCDTDYPTNTPPGPVPTPTPLSGHNYSLGVDADNNGQDDCTSRTGGQASCVAGRGTRFTLKIYLDRLPFGTRPYLGMDLAFSSSGVVATHTHHWVWPHCVFQGVNYSLGHTALGCAVGVAVTGSTYVGVLVIVEFNCTDSGQITLLHRNSETALVGTNGASVYEPADESIQIVCSTSLPTATPTARPTVTPTPTPRGDPRGPSMALQVYKDKAQQQLSCGLGALHRQCAVSSSGSFSVNIRTDAGPPGGYQGYQAVLQYSGTIRLVDQSGLAENRWPRCAGLGLEQSTAPVGSALGRYIVGCTTTSAAQVYEGSLANVHFACTGPGTGSIAVIAGAGSTVSFYQRQSISGSRIFLAGDSSGGQVLADAVVVRC